MRAMIIRVAFIGVLSLLLVNCGRDEISVLQHQAGQGDALSQRLLGEAYYFGNEVSQDFDKAFLWFKSAAEQGEVEAQFILGFSFYSGKRVNKDYEEAVYWLRLASEQGHAGAQRILAGCYYFGKGVSQDYSMAYAWCNMPVNQTNQTADIVRSKCLKKMTPKQKEKAERLSRIYIRQFDNQQNAP